MKPAVPVRGAATTDGGDGMGEQPEQASQTVEAPRTPRALVIGGGIAGIQAALDLADARIPVTVVERSPSLGGRMAQLDKTFPTMDCAI
jgi:heterodisulfide reductase subunit A-like polyferredoxin